MKLIPVLILAATVALPFSAPAADKKIQAGPNGGRIMKSVTPAAEFFVTKDRKVQITFLNEAGKPIPSSGQVVSVVAGERSAPTRMSFKAAGEGLLSEQTLPAGNGFPTVVQIKTSSDAKPVLEKFNLNMVTCPECNLAEYACTCGH